MLPAPAKKNGLPSCRAEGESGTSLLAVPSLKRSRLAGVVTCMERGFLGVNWKEGERWSFRDVAHWPYAETKCSQQQFLPSKASQRGRRRINSFDHLSSSGFRLIHSTDAANANHRSTIKLLSQKGSIIDWQGAQPFQTDATPPRGAKTFNTTLCHHTNEIKASPVISNYISFNQIKVKGVDSGPSMEATSVPLVGSAGKAISIGTPSKARATTAQMAIFYAGEVNVYDNIPLDKAHEIIFLATMEANMPSNVANMRQKVLGPDEVGVRAININQTPIDRNMETRCMDPPSPVSVTSHYMGGLSMSGNAMGQNFIDLTAIEGFHGPNLIKALPMARKASLARFLEKRKERLVNAAPYTLAQKSVWSTLAIDAANTYKKSVATEMVIASSREPLCHLGTSQGKIEARSPSTKREI